MVALVAGGMAATTNTSVTGLLLTSIAEDLGHSVALLGGLKSLSAVVAFATAFPLSRIADQAPRKYLILLGLTCMLVASLCALSATNLYIFVGYYIFTGAADVILFAMLLAAASDYVAGPGLDRINGVVIGAFGLPGLLIVPLAGAVSDSYGWRRAYLINLGIATTAMFLILFLLPRMPPTGSKPTSTLGHLRMLARKPGLSMILIGNVMRFTLLTVLIVYVAAFLIDRFDLSDGQAGLYFGIGSAVFLLAAFTSGLLIARIGLRKLMVPGGLVLSGGLLVAFLPGLPGIVTGAALMLSGAILSIQENGALGVILRLAPDDRGAATSLNEIGAAVAGVIGSGVGGLIINVAGYNGLAAFLAAIGVAAFVFTRRSFHATAEPVG